MRTTRAPSSPPPLCSWPRVRVAPARARLPPRRPRLRHRPPRPPRRPRRRRWPRPHRPRRRMRRAKDSLATKTAGKLTIGTDNPAYPPYYLPREGGNDRAVGQGPGRPDDRQGLRERDRLRRGRQARVHARRGHLDRRPVRQLVRAGSQGVRLLHQPGRQQARARPGRRPLRQLLRRQSGGRRRSRTRKFVSAKTVAELKDAKLGAQVGTTSLDAIENVIKPTTRGVVYDTNDAAIDGAQGEADRRPRRRPPDLVLHDRGPDRGNTIVGPARTGDRSDARALQPGAREGQPAHGMRQPGDRGAPRRAAR